MTNGNNRGSTLVMVLIAILILSMIAVSSLTQSDTELGTARNFVMGKRAFYAAEAGLDDGINQIKNSNMNPAGVSFTSAFDNMTYYSGEITDASAQYVEAFQGFKPPPPIGQSIEMGGELGMGTAAWNLFVTAGSATGTKNQTLKQLRTVVVTMVSEY